MFFTQSLMIFWDSPTTTQQLSILKQRVNRFLDILGVKEYGMSAKKEVKDQAWSYWMVEQA